MAETSKGKKFVGVKGYTKTVGNHTVKVHAAIRSTPKTASGKKRK
jgi:hypothetical protein